MVWKQHYALSTTEENLHRDIRYTFLNHSLWTKGLNYCAFHSIKFVSIKSNFYIWKLTNIVKGECRGKPKSHFRFDYAEPHPIFYKYSERRAQRQTEILFPNWLYLFYKYIETMRVKAFIFVVLILLGGKIFTVDATEKHTIDIVGIELISPYRCNLTIYNPQIEMFARFKMKSSFHKTKRII